MPVTTIGLDLAKNVFQAHGASATGAVVFRRKLRRDKVLAFLATQPSCRVVVEACASAHYWGREIAKLGHEVRLIAPVYVKPFVKRQKNDVVMLRPSAKPRNGRPCALSPSRARQSKPQRSSSAPAICWSGSEHRPSMRSVVI